MYWLAPVDFRGKGGSIEAIRNSILVRFLSLQELTLKPLRKIFLRPFEVLLLLGDGVQSVLAGECKAAPPHFFRLSVLRV